jgi:hypothetical protein
MIIKFISFLTLLILNFSLFSQDEVFKRNLQIIYSDFNIDSNKFIKTFENNQLIVKLINNDSLSNFDRNIDDNIFSFSNPFQQDFDYVISLKITNNLCNAIVINSGGMVISNSFINVWEISKGYYFVKYIEMIDPLKNNVIEFAFKPKKP